MTLFKLKILDLCIKCATLSPGCPRKKGGEKKTNKKTQPKPKTQKKTTENQAAFITLQNLY